jgi:H+/Cl- antiporter ClcA
MPKLQQVRMQLLRGAYWQVVHTGSWASGAYWQEGQCLEPAWPSSMPACLCTEQVASDGALTPSCCACLQAYLNGIDVPGIFLFKTLVGKIVGSIGAVAGGLAIGKEGPFVHAGAAVGALLCQVGARTRL